MRGPFEQQPPPERARRFADARPDEPVEVETRQVGTSGQVDAGQVGLVETVLDQVENPAKPIGAVHVDHPDGQPAGAPDQDCSVGAAARTRAPVTQRLLSDGRRRGYDDSPG